MESLGEKVAVVTGGTRGIGRAIVERLLHEGVSVAFCGRTQESVDAALHELSGKHSKLCAHAADVTDPHQVRTFFEGVDRAFGGLDILVNNAGGSNSRNAVGWFETPLDEWAESYRQNALPAVRLAQAFVPAMRDRGWGRVIQISSRNAISAYAQFGPYGAAKAALNNLTLSLSKALAGTGVTSNGIMPGLIYTPLVEPWFKALATQLGSEDPKVGQDFALKNVIQQTVSRLGQPRDVAAAVCFIASPLSDFMTGTTFRIDGGATPTV
jgi:3-oxoacyl-[acyl-carrier protein] reductase